NRTLGLFYPTPKPDRAEIPAPPDVASLVKDYKGSASRAEGEVFDASPANIEARTTRSALPNGFKLALLPKKTRGNVGHAVLNLRFGTEESLTNLSTAGSLAADMLMRGTKTKTRQQIQDEFDKLKARVNVFGGVSSVQASVETTRENL